MRRELVQEASLTYSWERQRQQVGTQGRNKDGRDEISQMETEVNHRGRSMCGVGHALATGVELKELG